jgi:GNAT superfamily N-acetyltransferase
MTQATAEQSQKAEVQIDIYDTWDQLPQWFDSDRLVSFLHESLKPYEDTPEDIYAGLDHALGEATGPGGFLVLATHDDTPLGALVMLDTGMSGYIPENLLLFVAVHPDGRGRGLGKRIISAALQRCNGPVKLHVEYDNPAKRLYERIGFTSNYAEMRYTP